MTITCTISRNIIFDYQRSVLQRSEAQGKPEVMNLIRCLRTKASPIRHILVRRKSKSDESAAMPQVYTKLERAQKRGANY